MKKSYEKPELNVETFDITDVITASSGTTPTPSGNELDQVGTQNETPGFVF